MLDALTMDLIKTLHTCLDDIENDLANYGVLDAMDEAAINIFIEQCEALEYDHVSSEFYAATDLYVRCLVIKTAYTNAVEWL